MKRFRIKAGPILALLALETLVVACATAHAPVPVLGASADVAKLGGEWVGEYSSAATGRSGSIVFTLTARGDSAYGDVVMIPVGWGRPLRPWVQSVPPGAQGPQPEVLSISFVRVEGGRVSGTLVPYADPESGARLTTTFVGELKGDTVAGTFTTRGGPSPDAQSGRWSVTRRKAP